MGSKIRRVDGRHDLSAHAIRRMHERRITLSDIESTLDYGRKAFTRGAVIHAIGRNEIRRWQREGVQLKSCEGIQVVTAMSGTILTVYRNRDFQKLRSGLGRGRHNPACNATVT